MRRVWANTDKPSRETAVVDADFSTERTYIAADKLPHISAWVKARWRIGLSLGIAITSVSRLIGVLLSLAFGALALGLIVGLPFLPIVSAAEYFLGIEMTPAWLWLPGGVAFYLVAWRWQSLASETIRDFVDSWDREVRGDRDSFDRISVGLPPTMPLTGDFSRVLFPGEAREDDIVKGTEHLYRWLAPPT